MLALESKGRLTYHIVGQRGLAVNWLVYLPDIAYEAVAVLLQLPTSRTSNGRALMNSLDL